MFSSSTQLPEMAAIAAARTGRWQVALLMAQSYFGKQLAVQSCAAWLQHMGCMMVHDAFACACLCTGAIWLLGSGCCWLFTADRRSTAVEGTGFCFCCLGAAFRAKVDLEGGALRGRGEHVEILVRPGAAPSNAARCISWHGMAWSLRSLHGSMQNEAIWCVTARDWLEQRLVKRPRWHIFCQSSGTSFFQ